MPRNVEVKARLDNVEKATALAASIADSGPEVIEQEDVFFNVPRGRLKLRILSPTEGKLIFYERPDQYGPKLARYSIFETAQPFELKDILSRACGVKNVVRKTRRLYMVGRTRIHIDNVESLGDFLELEVVLAEAEDPSVGEAEAREWMEKLGIESLQLVDKAYVDLLERKAG
jgi:adenylate cyclase